MNGKRLLFIAHCFPPVNIPGAVRAAKVCKFLSARGWQITVLTAHQHYWASKDNQAFWRGRLNHWGVRLLTTPQPLAWRLSAYSTEPSSGLRRIAEGIGRRVLDRIDVPRETMWIAGAKRKLDELEPGIFDVVLATASPYASFALARYASTKLRCPFVLDYRDLWGTSPHPLPKESLRGIEEEPALCAAAHGILGVSPSLIQSLRDHFGAPDGSDHDKFKVLTNGFDPDDMSPLRNLSRSQKRVLYAGVFYPPKRTITPVMEALRWIKTHHIGRASEICFAFYGIGAAHVREEATRCGVEDMVEINGRVPRADALKAIAQAALSVVITSVDTQGSQADRGVVTSKIFDAMGLGTPILLIAPEHSDAEDIIETSSAGQTFRGADIKGIAEAILHYTQAAENSTADVMNGPYAWPQLAMTLENYLAGAQRRYVIQSDMEL